MGLRIQLNHLNHPCTNPEPCHVDFRVMHHNGIHDVNLDFCGCVNVQPKHIQLLRRRLFPATQANPRTCATFSLLTAFHLLNLTSKIAVYDFYRSIERLTDNTGLCLPKSRYRAFMRMTLQWRHLKLLKRHGRGHDESGVAGTKPGELAIQCPTCPRLGVNLPQDWKQAPPDEQYVISFDKWFKFRALIFVAKVYICTHRLYGRKLPPQESNGLQLLSRSRHGYWIGLYGASKTL